MKISKIGGIIAAAGKDAAMSLLQVGAIPIIRRIVISYQQAGVFPIVVITGNEEEEVKHQLFGYGVIFLRNGKQEQPELMDSVRIGLQYLQGKCDRVVFTPVNVPMFTPNTLTLLIQTQGKIVAPSYHGKGGHPVFIHTDLIPQILAYTGEDGLRGALSQCTAQWVWVDVEDKGVLANARDEVELQAQLEDHNNAILHPVLHMCIEKEKPFFFARLKLLLFLIGDTQNMRLACAYSAVAHSNAWEMINHMEQSLGYSVVERQRGGKTGGSTKLTPEGERFLLTYQEFEETIHQFTQEEFQKRFICTKIIL